MHTGSHKLNNALGQALLARRMGKTRIIAETGAGQHGVAQRDGVRAARRSSASSTWAPRTCAASSPTCSAWSCSGARVVPVEAGARTLKEAVSEAIRDWVTNVADTHYVIGSAVGPAPYPAIVRDLQRVIGDEARAQLLERDGPAARPRDRVRRRRLERDRDVRRASSTTPASSWSASRPAGEGIETGRHGAPLTVGGPPGRPARLAARRSCRTRRARSSRRTRSRPASTTPAPGPSTRGCATRAARATSRSPTTQALADVPPRRAARGHHPGARDRARAACVAAEPADGELDLVCLLGARRQGPRRGAGAAARS